MTYNDIEKKPDPLALTETVRLSADSNDKYKNSRLSDQSESDTESDTVDNDILDATRAGLRHRSGTAEG